MTDRVTLHEGDCMAVMRQMIERGERMQSIVTDPPYHLTSIVKRRFGGEGAAPAKVGKAGAYARASAGFMGKQWDGGDIAFRPETWRLCWELLPPGGQLVAFAATRNYHRLACAIEDAGFEIRDCIAWVYGCLSDDAEVLQNAYAGVNPNLDPCIMARKPLIGTVAENVLAHGTGAINVDGCRVGTDDNLNGGAYSKGKKDDGEWGTMHRAVPDAEYQQPAGRWPANLIHDGSDEVVGLFPQQNGVVGARREGGDKRIFSGGGHQQTEKQRIVGGTKDTGSAARFFYCAKATAEEREAAGTTHPTVKPVALMRWLVRLITPPGGTVLDPFAGTGTTGAAAMAEGFRAVLIEREAEYAAGIRRRLARMAGLGGPLFGDVA